MFIILLSWITCWEFTRAPEATWSLVYHLAKKIPACIVFITQIESIPVPAVKFVLNDRTKVSACESYQRVAGFIMLFFLKMGSILKFKSCAVVNSLCLKWSIRELPCDHPKGKKEMLRVANPKSGNLCKIGFWRHCLSCQAWRSCSCTGGGWINLCKRSLSMSPNRCGTANRRLVTGEWELHTPWFMESFLSFLGFLCIYPTVGHLCDQSSPLVSQHLVSIRLKTELVDLVCPFALGGARLPLSYEKCLGERLLLFFWPWLQRELWSLAESLTRPI